MASTRFQSGIDDGPRPPASSPPSQRPRDRSGARHHHIENPPAAAAAPWDDGGSAIESCIDDRCPTVWHAPRRPAVPQARVGRRLDAPVSAEAARPIFAPPHARADGAAPFASAIHPAHSAAPAPNASAIDPGPAIHLALPRQTPTVARASSRLRSAIDPGSIFPPPPPSTVPPYRARDEGPGAPVPLVDAGSRPPGPSLPNVPRTPGIKQLTAGLLRKLWKHAENERRRADEAVAPHAAATHGLPELAPDDTGHKQPRGFLIPDRAHLRAAREHGKLREQHDRQDAEAAKREAARRHEKTVDHVQPQKQTPPERDQTRKRNPPSTPHQNRPNNRYTERAEAARVAAEALMSGALLTGGAPHPAPGSAQDSGVGLGGMSAAAAGSSHPQQRSTSASQPRAVPSAASHSPSATRDAARQPRPTGRPPSQPASPAPGCEQVGPATFPVVGPRSASRPSRTRSASEQPSSSHAWEEVGQATFHVVGSRSASRPSPTRSASEQTSSPDGWEEVGQAATPVPVFRPASNRSSSLGWQEVHAVAANATSAQPRKDSSRAGWEEVGPGNQAWAAPTPDDDASRAPSMHGVRSDGQGWTKEDFEIHHGDVFGPVSKASSQRSCQRIGKDWAHSRHSSSQQRSGALHSSSVQYDSGWPRVQSQRSGSKHPSAKPSSPYSDSALQPVVELAESEEPPHDPRAWEHRPQSIAASQHSHHSDIRTHSRRTSTVSPQPAASAFEPSVHGSEAHSRHSEAGGSHHSLCREHAEDGDQPYPRPATHHTAYAGRGWITPHPLSAASSAVAPQSKVILPSEARAQARTLTYDEWKEMQERGMRLHRNISITESSKTTNGIFHDERYRHPGWNGRPREPAEDRSRASRHSARPSTHRSPTTLRSERRERSVTHSHSGSSGTSARPSGGYAETIRDSQHPSASPS